MIKTQPKFKIGDKVRLTSRAPYMVKEGLLSRTRTVIDAFYDSEHECYYYQLGGKGRGELGYWFRSYMLRRVKQTEHHQIGRPREKRRYGKRV